MLLVTADIFPSFLSAPFSASRLQNLSVHSSLLSFEDMTLKMHKLPYCVILNYQKKKKQHQYSAIQHALRRQAVPESPPQIHGPAHMHSLLLLPCGWLNWPRLEQDLQGIPNASQGLAQTQIPYSEAQMMAGFFFQSSHESLRHHSPFTYPSISFHQ